VKGRGERLCCGGEMREADGLELEVGVHEGGLIGLSDDFLGDRGKLYAKLRPLLREESRPHCPRGLQCVQYA
jgi:hypothetical protein